MPNNIIDELSIKISAEATTAVNALNSVVLKLGQLSTKLGSLSGIRVTSFITPAAIRQITAFGTAINGLNLAKAQAFASTIQTLSSLGGSVSFRVNGGGMSSLAKGIDAINVTKLRQIASIDFSNMRILADASKEIRGLTSELRRLQRLTERAEQVQKKLQNSLEKTKKATRASSNAFHAHNGVLGKFFASIKRIAYYRAIRAALRAFTQGLSEGIENLYRWSQATGTSFAPAMDRLATAVLYLKNGFASMWSPLIERAIPVIDALIDKFVEFFNFVQEGFARLTGQETWNRALKYPVQYKDALDDASASAKAFKNQLMGFDELNVISTPTDSSRGSGSDALDYSAMFELMETNFDEEGESLGERLAKALNKGLENWNPTATADGMWDAFELAFYNAFDFLKSVDWTLLGEKVSAFLTEFCQRLQKWVGDVPWGDVIMAVSDSITKFIDGFDLSGIINALTKLGMKLAVAVPEILMGIVESIYRTTATIFNKIGLKSIGNFFSNTADTVKTARTAYQGFRQNVLNPLVDKMVDGTEDSGYAISTAMANSIDHAFGQANLSGGKGNHGSGASFGEDVEINFKTSLDGKDESIPIMTSRFEQFGQKVKGLFSGDLKVKFQTWYENAKQTLAQVGANISTWWTTKKQQIENSPLYLKIKSSIENIALTVQQAWGKVTSWWSGVKLNLSDKFTAPDIKTKIFTAWMTFKSWWDNFKGLSLSDKFSIPNLLEKVQRAFYDVKAWLSQQSVSLAGHIKTPHFSITDQNGGYGYTLNPAQWVKNRSTIPKINVSWYAQGGFLPDQFSLFGMGEGGIPEMLGTVGGKNAVAGGAEITGIRNAIERQAEQDRVFFTQLIAAVNNKDLTLVANSSTGRWVNKALKAYSGVTG